jgi:adenylate cyclase
MKPFLKLFVDRRPQPRRTVHDILTDLGYSAEEIEQAEADGTAELLVLEGLVLPGPGRLTIGELAGRARVSVDLVHAVWRAMGFADVDDDDRVFTFQDAEMFVRLRLSLEEGLIDPDRALQMTRVLGVSMAQFATAVVDTMEGHSAERRRAADEADELELDDAAPEEDSLAVRTGMLLPLMSDSLDYAFRRHLKNATQRRIALATGLAGDGQVVGFADLVRFTTLARELDERGLGELMDRFDVIANDVVVKHDGRIVKMIGDESMFTVLDPASGARLALELAARVEEDEQLPGLRIGLAYGQVLARDGDLYGPVVNLASRLVQLGAPGSIHVSRELRDEIRYDDEFRCRSAGLRRLKHIGSRRIYRLRPGPLWEPSP